MTKTSIPSPTAYHSRAGTSTNRRQHAHETARNRSLVGGYNWRRHASEATAAMEDARREMQGVARHQLPREVTERLLKVSLHLGSAQGAISRLREIRRE